MGEIFPAEKPAEALEFTGERLTSAAHGQVEIEHFHRYFLARDLCRGKDVLDIASGEGYGSALLAQVARSVVGVEIVPAIAAHAARSYPRRNLRFVAGDARAIPLRDGAVDVVVSFETIEHLYEHDRFVAEIKRVLRPGGVVIVSTPERDVYSPYNSSANPYHCHELTKQEFLRLLNPAFSSVRLMSQRPMLGSAMLLDDFVAGDQRTALTFERRGEGHFEACEGLPRPLYVVAFASDQPLDIPAASLYVETSHLDLRDQQRAQMVQRKAEERAQEFAGKIAALDAEIAALSAEVAPRHGEIAALKAEITALNAQIAAADAEVASRHGEIAALKAEITALNAQIAAADAEIAELKAEIADLKDRIVDARARAQQSEQRTAALDAQANALRVTLESIYASTSWRILRPLHRFGAGHPRLAKFVRRSIKGVWWTVTLQLGTRIRQYRAARRADSAPGDAVSALSALQLSPTVGAAAHAVPRPGGGPTRVLGTNVPLKARHLAIGIVTYNTSARELRRMVTSAEVSLRQAGVACEGRVLVVDNGEPTEAITAGNASVRRLPSAGNLGFGAGHNRLMQAAFDAGAEIYIAANPDGMFHPGAVTALLREIQATEDRALVEAIQFPEEHPKIYDPETLDTPWASGACLAIPRKIFEEIGGFDESFFLYCEDVDLSWRARAAGFSVKICPSALFFHSVTNRPGDPQVERRFRESGVILARKWADAKFERELIKELRRAGIEPPRAHPRAVPEEWRAVADFSHLFHFAPTRWG